VARAPWSAARRLLDPRSIADCNAAPGVAAVQHDSRLHMTRQFWMQHLTPLPGVRAPRTEVTLSPAKPTPAWPIEGPVGLGARLLHR
jgi:hypothetical protein